jgi:hypothetical protein
MYLYYIFGDGHLGRCRITIFGVLHDRVPPSLLVLPGLRFLSVVLFLLFPRGLLPSCSSSWVGGPLRAPLSVTGVEKHLGPLPLWGAALGLVLVSGQISGHPHLGVRHLRLVSEEATGLINAHISTP